ncbi:MAG: hypothetical protein P8X47_07135 [Ignavibacteriaceae bacterium]
MKILFSILIFYSVLFGQIEKNTIGFNGNIDFKLGKNDIERGSYDFQPISYPKTYSTFRIHPSVHYFIRKNISLGLIFTYEYSQVKYTGTAVSTTDAHNEKSKSYLIGPVFRYYFNIGNILPFLSISYQVGKKADIEERSMKILNNKFSYSQNLLKSGIGLSIFIVKNIALEFLFSANRYEGNLTSPHPDFHITSEKQKDNYFNSEIGFNFYLK